MTEGFTSGHPDHDTSGKLVRVTATGRLGAPRIGLWSLVAVALVPIAAALCFHALLPQWHWENHPVHALIEGVGAFAALMLAVLLLSRSERDSANLWVALGLIGMGSLDGFHAATHAGNTFVWLHSFASLIGGLTFAGVYLPTGLTVLENRPRAPWLMLAGAWSIGILSLTLHDSVPAMRGETGFTSLAIGMNLLGAAGFFASAVFFRHRYRHDEAMDHALFSHHCVLLGTAGVIFPYSVLWGPAWWMWHMLRLAAYGIGTGYAFLTYRRTAEEIRQARDLLDERVRDRTAELKVEMEAHARAAAELKTYAEELARSNDELDDFAYVASHDLKEPLRGIHNFSSFLIADYANMIDDEGRRKLETLGRLAQRMETLIDALLYYSRVGRHDLAIEDADLNDVVEQIRESLAPWLEEQGATLHVAQALPRLYCDRVHVGEVLRNLVVNGVKYNEAPLKRIEIGHVEPGSPKAPVTLYVRDNGIGIRDKHREKIFSIFTRLHARDRYGGGTGAGLTIAKKIVERHGGRIWVESEPGAGSTFYFTLEGEPP